MVVHTLDVAGDPFRLKEDEEQVFEPKVPYLSAINTLLYLAQCIRLDILFVVNLLHDIALCQHTATGMTLKTFLVTL